jgi:hypothetical protein
MRTLAPYHHDRQLAISLSLIVILIAGYFFQGGQFNENSRFDQIRALAEEGTFFIDSFSYNTRDVIQIGERVLPNKPPGTVFLGVGPWIAARAIALALGYSPGFALNFACYLTTFLLSGLTTLLITLLIFRMVVLQCGDHCAAYLCALAYALCSIALPFSTLFFPHQLTAALLFSSFFLLFDYARRPRDSQHGYSQALQAALAGLLATYSIVSEYSAVFGLLPISIYAYTALRSWRRIAAYAVGTVMGLLPLAFYNLAVFDSLFFFTHQAYAFNQSEFSAEHSQGLMGARLPSLEGFSTILFSQSRGLFFFSPWLLALIPSTIYALRGGRYRTETTVALVLSCSFVVFNAGFGSSIFYWGGGASLGPRYLTPALPFAILLCSYAFGYKPARPLLCIALFYSASILLVATAIEPRAPSDNLDPLSSFYLPRYAAGEFSTSSSQIFADAPGDNPRLSTNLGIIFGCARPWSLFPLISALVLAIAYGLYYLPVSALGSAFLALLFLCLGLYPAL